MCENHSLKGIYEDAFPQIRYNQKIFMSSVLPVGKKIPVNRVGQKSWKSFHPVNPGSDNNGFPLRIAGMRKYLSYDSDLWIRFFQ